MTIAQAIVTYAVCWWMVLFMVLPQGVEREETPGPGHAPSAPKNPNLKQKFKRTSWLAIIPTILLYLVATAARAEETIYHVGSGCTPLEKYVPSADLNAKDGEGLNGEKVAPATLGGGGDASAFDSVEIPLQLPSQKYTTNSNADLSHSFIDAGTLTVTREGDTLLNGKSIGDSTLTSGECDHAN